MKIAFVGVKRKYKELSPEYRDVFNHFHLELPYYYACDGANDVTITSVDYESNETHTFDSGGSLRCQQETSFKDDKHQKYDIVVHWRKWHPELYRQEALNVINCQDHSFDASWKDDVINNYNAGKLYGILCFPTWHKRNLLLELKGFFPADRAIDGVTLGVDTDIYCPASDKDQYQMLWASDPGRGLHGALSLAHELFKFDKRFRLNICWPDYVKNFSIPSSHPAFIIHSNVNNGPKLWKLFGSTGILPYTSTFNEPSSRAHRQAMAAGSLVLYPRNMGSPSELILNNETGIVADVTEWARIIVDNVSSGVIKDIGTAARKYAISENWKVQSERFNKLFSKILKER